MKSEKQKLELDIESMKQLANKLNEVLSEDIVPLSDEERGRLGGVRLGFERYAAMIAEVARENGIEVKGRDIETLQKSIALSAALEVLYAKIHRATVTHCNPDYMGSITIDPDLLDATGLRLNEKVLVADVDNANRFETYIFKGERGTGLGLANVYAFVQRHGGTIDLTTAEGQGATFRLEFPAAAPVTST